MIFFLSYFTIPTEWKTLLGTYVIDSTYRDVVFMCGKCGLPLYRTNLNARIHFRCRQ